MADPTTSRDGLGLSVVTTDGLTVTVGAPDRLEVVVTPDVPDATDVPVVTVVVPARDEERTIEACLDALLGQDLGPDVTAAGGLEVVVVDNGSTDATPRLLAERAARDPRVVVLTSDVPSIPRALNTALAAARGRWLVRVDAHSTVPQGYVRRAVERLEEGRWVGVGGRKDAVASTPAGRTIATVLGSRLGVGGSVYHHGTTEQVVDHVPFGAYPVDLVRSLGGWDETVANNEDFELDQRLRAHGELLFDPRLRIAWRSKETVGDLFRQYRRYGSGKPRVAARHPGSVSPRHLAPPALVVWLAVAGVVALRRPGAGAVMVLPYAAGLVAASAVTARSLPADASVRTLPGAFAAMHVGWGLGFLEGLVAVRRR